MEASGTFQHYVPLPSSSCWAGGDTYPLRTLLGSVPLQRIPNLHMIAYVTPMITGRTSPSAHNHICLGTGMASFTLPRFPDDFMTSIQKYAQGSKALLDDESGMLFAKSDHFLTTVLRGEDVK